MSIVCAILDCQSTNDSTTLYSFPTDNKNLLEKWLHQIPGLKKSEICDKFICEDHFDYKDIKLNKNGIKYLVPGAVPIQSESIKNVQKVCRFCLNEIQNKEDQFEIDNETKRYFKDLTNFKLKEDKELPSVCCKDCFRNMKNSAFFKFLIIKNQKQLMKVLKTTDNFNYHEFSMLLEPKTEISEDIHIIKPEPNSESNDMQPEAENIDHGNEQPDIKVKDYHSEKFPCPHCTKILTKNGLAQHLKRFHAVTNNFECDFCGHQVVNRGQLKKHLLNKHIHVPKKVAPSRPDKICEYCGLSFKEKRNYDYHIRSKHTFEKPYQCMECKKSFLTSSYLLEHVKVFHKSEPVICDICSSSFKSLNRLKLHKKRTHVEKKFECPYEECNKKFKIGYHLKNHIAIHTGSLKTYSCENCGASYNRLSHLRRHVRTTHTDWKISCTVTGCKAQYSRRDFLRSHILKQHQNIGAENLKTLLERIKQIKMPDIQI